VQTYQIRHTPEGSRTTPAEVPAGLLDQALLVDQQERHRYLRILEEPSSVALGPADALPALLRPPATLPDDALDRDPGQQDLGQQDPDQRQDPDDVQRYLAHSCDLVLSGGLTAALAQPLATCALAEHYVIRRVAGTSAGAVTAAFAAAAEHGRGAPVTRDRSHGGEVGPGFAGLAQVMAWLAGQDAEGQNAAGSIERWRLAEMLQPSPENRTLYRLLAVLMRPGGGGARLRALRAVGTGCAALDRGYRGVLGLVWAGALVGWAGVTIALLRTPWLERGAGAAVVSTGLLVTFVLAALAASAVCVALAMRSGMRGLAGRDGWGLCSGMDAPDGRSTGGAGLEGGGGPQGTGGSQAGDVPALMTWIADRIDDLAGVPAPRDPMGDDPATTPDRHALTFADLWLRRLDRVPDDGETLWRASQDREHRAIDLTLLGSDLSRRMPYALPFSPQGQRLMFCHECLLDVAPGRVVRQLQQAAPDAAIEPWDAVTCPRHEDVALRQLPDPWDLPIALAVRISAALPGVLTPVPLYSRAMPTDVGAIGARTHWFCDGAVTAPLEVTFFDAPLPRWPTFGLTEGEPASTLTAWRPASGLRGLLDAIAGSALRRGSTRAGADGDALGRVAGTGAVSDVRGRGPFLTQECILRLAERGHLAGTRLRETFTGPDGGLTGQTWTDRYRWIRLRTALRDSRELSRAMAGMPLYRDLAARYRIPAELTTWFAEPVTAGATDPQWGAAVSAMAHARALRDGGVLDRSADDGALHERTDVLGGS
jgi:hypothetical protein